MATVERSRCRPLSRAPNDGQWWSVGGTIISMPQESSPKKPSNLKKKILKVPVWLYLTAVFLVLAIAVGSGGNSSDSPTTPTSQDAATTQAATTQATTTMQAATTQAATTTQAAAPKPSVCRDPQNDSNTNDLTSVVLSRSGDYLNVRWEVAALHIGTGTAGFYVNLASEDGDEAGQVGVKYLDGQQIAYFTFTFDSVMQTNMSGDALVAADSITGAFPMSELQQYGPNFSWSAVSMRDGKDVDACPAAGMMLFVG